MPTFAYLARTKSGEQVAGTREAEHARAALEALRAAELFVTELKEQAAEAGSRTSRRSRAVRPQAAQVTGAEARPVPPQVVEQGPETRAATPSGAEATGGSAAGADRAHANAGPPPLSRQPMLFASAKETSLYFRQLHAMLDAGTGISAALTTMSQHSANGALRNASAQMAKQTARGGPLSEQMRAFPGLFSQLMIGMVAAGENGGFLDRMCARLADYSERDYELQQTVKRETWYPKLLVCASILIPATVPAVLAWNSGGNGPATFVRTILPPFLALLALMVAWRYGSRALAVGAHDGALRVALDGLKFGVPVVAKVTRALAAAKFCRALGALYAAGMGAGRMVDVAASACGNAAFAERVRKAIPAVQNGSPMTEALAATRQFPPIALQMLTTGEQSGRIDEQLEKVAGFLEADAETAVKQAVKVLSMLLYLGVAAYIGVTIVSQWVGAMSKVVDEGIQMAE